MVDNTLPVLTAAFVTSSIDFAEQVPSEIREAMCHDIISYSHVYSWNAFDLSCIQDMPNRVIRIDPSHTIQLSRQHLYTPFNQAILHSRYDSFIHIGIFTPAPPECRDKTQLTIIKTAKDRT